MGVPPNPIGHPPKDPYEGYKAEAIQPEKREHEAPEKEGKNQPALLGALILFLISRFVQFFSKKSERGLSEAKEKEVKETLLLFKAALEILKIEDRSQDIDFVNRLSTLWHVLLENSLQFKRSSPFATQFRALIKEIRTYPENNPHTLGYYLSEISGQSWLPFPYMELIGRMHHDYEENGSESRLTKWTDQIDQLLSYLNQD